MNLSPRFTIPAAVVHREVDQQMVLLDLATEQYYGLDEVGTRIVGRLTTAPYDDAVAALLDEFEVERDVLTHDIDELVDELIAKGLLMRTDEAG